MVVSRSQATHRLRPSIKLKWLAGETFDIGLIICMRASVFVITLTTVVFRRHHPGVRVGAMLCGGSQGIGYSISELQRAYSLLSSLG